jgi:formylmethanofuran--tetrahydromethanopterin N-formyltransferase
LNTAVENLPGLLFHGVTVRDTFAEAFPITGTRIIITAATPHWARIAATVCSGYATSVIACDLECSIERVLATDETPDGRPGVALLAFAFSRDKLAAAIVNRVGQCVLTCPTTACFNGLLDGAADKRISIGGQLRFFGDSFQSSKLLDGRRYWRIPTMDGEFVCEDKFGTTKGVAGGNLLIGGRNQRSALLAAEAAAQAVRLVPGTILPFPGGIVRSGSKVGSRYKKLVASTNEAYCPTLAGVVVSELPVGTNCMYELVIDGLTLASVTEAMRVALVAAVQQPDVTLITAGNYGGKLGPYHIRLRDFVEASA